MARSTITLSVLMACSLILAGCGGGSSTTGDTPEPVIGAVTPLTGGVTGGTDLTIEGRHFTNRGLGITEVLVGGFPATKIVVHSDTKITCATPPNIVGMVDVSVTKNHGTGTMADAFTYNPPPQIFEIDVTDGSRDGGQLVVVTGLDFQDWEPGETRVLFGGVPGTAVMVLDNTTIEVMTPAVPFEKTVDVMVENYNGTATLPLSFTFRGPFPVLHGITPDTGSTDGGTEVTLTGELFSAASQPYTVMFGDIPGYGIVLVSQTEMLCSAPMTTMDGPVEVTISNANGTSTNSETFTYVAPPGTIRSIDPTSGFAEEETDVTITGTGFLDFNAGTPTVLFGEEDALDIVVVSDTTITCVAPGQPMGSVDVVVTNNRGTMTLPAAFEYLWIPVWETDFGDQLMLTDQKGGFEDKDEGYATVAIEFGDTGSDGFEFYGEEYAECYAAANGFINFSGKTYFTFSGAFGTYPQINVAGEDMWAESTSIKGSGVFAESTSELVTITFNGISWYSNSGYVIGQIQLHESGAFAILWDTISYGWGSIQVGCCPASPYTQGIVDFSSSLTFEEGDAPYDTFSSSLDDMVGKALTFYPDGNGGYVTRVFDID